MSEQSNEISDEESDEYLFNVPRTGRGGIGKRRRAMSNC